AGMTLDGERAERCFAGRNRYVLPNGLEIAHLNRYETEYLYQEVFEDQVYLKHGIALPDGATVLDIGANIGLFSLFVLGRCKNPKIYAFEPAPAVYELLKANCEAYAAANVRVLNLGVSDRARTASLTFYEKSSVFSGFYADEAADGAALQAIVRNTLKRESADEDESLAQYVTELTADRLRGTTHECRLTSVSHIIREHGIERIDLLKIDAEKSERDILEGIDEEDWPKIAQLVVEIHDPTHESVGRVRALLSAKGYRCEVEHEPLLEHSGLFNLYAIRDEARPASRPNDGLQRNVRDFCAALDGFMKQSSAPLILCVCPRTPAARTDRELCAALNDAERSLLAQAGGLPNVLALGSDAALGRYRLADYYDPHGHRLGRIPYTPACYAAIGTALYRTIFNLRRKPYKVIVLDCDDTLWRGACGEDGPMAVELSEPYRGLQQFMLEQMNAGMLLCLCSRNNEQDVLEVFDRRSDMVLGREHLASWRINWNRKSDNIRSLADELDLGLDSFIFVDDNPVECAEVRANCPGVLTLQLPQAGESFAAFLDHVWAFDHAGGTKEDGVRTRMYHEQARREDFRAQAGSLKDFIDGLQLRVAIGAPQDGELGRVSQLTFRTNQFTFTALRRSEQELGAFLRREGAGCLAVRVADRFGDYGLVGVVLYQALAERYKVDTLLLSCRVLGRGVEHAVLSHLGCRALEENKRRVELDFRPTANNAPAREFIERLGAPDGNGSDGSRVFAAERLARLTYNPGEAPPVPAAAAGPRRPPERGSGGSCDALQQVAQHLCDIDRLTDAIERHRVKGEPPAPATDAAPAGTLQATLLDIWRRVLGRNRIGLDDNFFEVGGSSLRAVQVVAAIRRELNRNMPIVSLFECPTVSLLAARLDPACGRPGGAPAASRAALRGRRRRSVVRRKAA
ncbi:MAG: FkbM family methyltransferase, partial [Burkholderiales bacterium]